MNVNQFLAASLLTISALGGCSSAPKQDGAAGPRVSEATYESLINKNTRHHVEYDGFYNKFELSTTFLNSDVQTTILQKRSDTLGWDNATAQKERERLFQENSTQVKFFMSFFSPTPRLNDLHKGSSIWKIYLEVEGKRYEGKVTKYKGKLEDIQAIYPYHTRWAMPFEVVFLVPLSGVENHSPVFMITSTQGSAKLQF